MVSKVLVIKSFTSFSLSVNICEISIHNDKTNPNINTFKK